MQRRNISKMMIKFVLFVHIPLKPRQWFVVIHLSPPYLFLCQYFIFASSVYEIEIEDLNIMWYSECHVGM